MSRRRWPTWASVLAIVVVALVAWSNSFRVPFIFDDKASIAENATIRSLWPPLQALSPPRHSTTEGRPVVNLSLAANYAVGGLALAGYHVVNLAIHMLAALVLLGLVRRTLLLPGMSEALSARADGLALAATLLWTAHPLQTQAVTYIIQRAEIMMALSYLLTLYCALRGFEAQRPARWYVAAVVACAVGMASKEAMVTAPVLVLLYDRSFLAGSFGQALRQRWRLYAGLAASWLVVAALVGSRSGTAGLGQGVSSFDYALTQLKAIGYYLRVAFWPSGIIFDHGWPIETRLSQVAPRAALILVLLAITAGLLWRRPKLGFLPAAFFIILSPTTSFVPVVTQTIGGHRMYLPLAAVAVLVVLSGLRAWTWCRERWLAAWPGGDRVVPVLVVGLTVVVLVGLTWSRNRDFETEYSIWEDTLSKYPHNPRAYNNRGRLLQARGEHDPAITDFDRAIELEPRFFEAWYNRGLSHQARGETEQALADYGETLSLAPEHAKAHINRGILLANLGDLEAALRDLDAAVGLSPDSAQAYVSRGIVFHKRAVTRGSRDDAQRALADFTEAIRLTPDDPEAWYNQGLTHQALGNSREALADYARAIAVDPEHAEAHVNRGILLAEQGDLAAALAAYDTAVGLRPDLVEAVLNRAHLRRRQGDCAAALGDYDRAVELAPERADSYYGRALCHLRGGRHARAVEDLTLSLERTSGDPTVYYYRALAHYERGDAALAAEDFEEALRLDGAYAAAGNAYAWLLATHPDPSIRDGARAVGLAKAACEQSDYGVPSLIDTLAAAQAEAGRFREAAASARKAVELARDAGRPELAAEIEARLRLYEQGRPWREPAD